MDAMKLTYRRSVRCFSLLAMMLVISSVIVGMQSSAPQRFEMFASCSRFIAVGMAFYACAELFYDARQLTESWNARRVRVFDVALCSLLFVNFVLGGILLVSVLVSSRA